MSNQKGNATKLPDEIMDMICVSSHIRARLFKAREKGDKEEERRCSEEYGEVWTAIERRMRVYADTPENWGK